MLTFGMDEARKNKFLGNRIKQAREAKGWSQDALADELDTKQATVARWESGSFPKRIGLPNIARALGRPVEWFQMPLLANEGHLEDLQQRLKALESSRDEVGSAREKQKLASIRAIADAWPDLHEGKQSICLYYSTGNEDFLSSFSPKTQALLRSIYRSLV